ncbi:MAG: peptidylprolyl isomerase [Thermomicrobiales bacterium]
MLDRVRGLIASITGRDDDGRFVSRAEREARQRRILIYATAALALIVVVTLAAGAIWQYFLVPRETYATVNGVDIRRSEYEKYRHYTLLQQLTSLNQQLQAASEDQRTGLQQQLAVLQVELEDLENGDKNINPEALQAMIQDQLVLQGMDDFGIVITDQEVDDYVDQLLAPVPLSEPTATLTVPPTAAAWATETTEEFYTGATATTEYLATETELTATAEAASTEEGEADGTASPEGTAAEGSPTAEAEATPDLIATSEVIATETASAPTGTPDPNASPTFTAVPTLEPTATPNREEAIATSEAGFDLLDRNFLDRADMSRGDFERLIVRPQLARVKLRDQLIQDIPTSQEQVRASHILVATRDAALELIDGRLQNEDFATVAEEVSTDTTSAVNGGDLGWFPRGIMTDPFEEVAFDLPVGEISEPVQTQFGWHIIKVTGHEEDRPLTISTLRALQQNAVDRWVQQQQEQASISAEVPLPDDNPANSGVITAP